MIVMKPEKFPVQLEEFESITLEDTTCILRKMREYLQDNDLAYYESEDGMQVIDKSMLNDLIELLEDISKIDTVSS